MTSSRVEAELKYTAADERPLRELATRRGARPGAPRRRAAPSPSWTDTSTPPTCAWRRLAGRAGCGRATGRTIVSLKGPAEHAAGDVLHRRPEVEGPADAEPGPAGLAALGGA